MAKREGQASPQRTVKLNGVVFERLERRAVLGTHRKDSQPDGLALTDNKDDSHGNSEEDQDDGKGVERPPKIDVGVEEVSNLGASKRRRDDGRLLNAKENQSVPQSRQVGEDDGDDVAQAEVADPIQGVTSGIGGHVLAHALGDHANHHEDNHDDKALATAPDVDDFCNGQCTDAAEDRGHNVSGRKQAMLAKGRSDEVLQIALHRLLELVDKGHEVETNSISSVSLARVEREKGRGAVEVQLSRKKEDTKSGGGHTAQT